MARPLRIEYPDAVHHVTSRGNERHPIFRTRRDRLKYLELLATAVKRFGWLVISYTMMTNHVHLVIETPQPNLSKGMQWLNGTYAQWFNRVHGRVGHLFQGRFQSELVEKETYLRNVVRYVALNPVRAKMVARPEDYEWSSYRAAAGYETPPPWLAVGRLAEHFGEADTWQANFRSWVEEKAAAVDSPWDDLRHQIFLGSKEWTRTLRAKVESKLRDDEHPLLQRTVGVPDIEEVVGAVAVALGRDREEVRRGGVLGRMAVAWIGWWKGGERLRSIAAALRLRSSGYVSDLVRRCEKELRASADLRALIDAALAQLAA